MNHKFFLITLIAFGTTLPEGSLFDRMKQSARYAKSNPGKILAACLLGVPLTSLIVDDIRDTHHTTVAQLNISKACAKYSGLESNKEAACKAAYGVYEESHIRADKAYETLNNITSIKPHANWLRYIVAQKFLREDTFEINHGANMSHDLFVKRFQELTGQQHPEHNSHEFKSFLYTPKESLPLNAKGQKLDLDDYRELQALARSSFLFKKAQDRLSIAQQTLNVLKDARLKQLETMRFFAYDPFGTVSQSTNN